MVCISIASSLISILTPHLTLTINSSLRTTILNLTTSVLTSCDVNNLPRVTRSQAFELIITAVSAVKIQEDHTETIGKDTAREAVEFVKMAVYVLEGEKDPRCLLRGLIGLRLCQVHLYPLTTPLPTTFPTTLILDCVRVYYPITFQPPKNDKHGITNEGLRNALNDVMSGVKKGNGEKVDLGGVISMILDRVGGESSTSEVTVTQNDRISSCLDLDYILRLQDGGWTIRGEEDIEDVRGSLIRGVEKMRGEGRKALLGIVTRMGRCLEEESRVHGNSSSGFVSGIIRDASFGIMDNPASGNGRSNVMLLCAVAKCGFRAMGECVDVLADGIMDMAKNREDRERAEAAADAIGELYGAADKDVSMVPCPIKKRSKQDFDDLKVLAIEGRSSSGLKAVASLACSTSQRTIDDVDAGGFCVDLADLLVRDEVEFESLSEGEREWMKAAAVALGGIGGCGRYPTAESVLRERIVEAASCGKLGMRTVVLLDCIGVACEINGDIKGEILERLAGRMQGLLGEGKIEAKSTAVVLETVIKRGRMWTGGEGLDVAREAAVGILRTLCSVGEGDDERVVALARWCIPYVLPLYKAGPCKSDTIEAFRTMLEGVGKGDKKERKRVLLTLPMLAAALEGAEEGGAVEDEMLKTMIEPLTVLSLDISVPADSRTAAIEAVDMIIRLGGLSCSVAAAGSIEKRLGSWLGLEEYVNSMRCLGVVGGSAACRGGESGRVADEIVVMLAELACKGESRKVKGLKGVEVEKVQVVAGEAMGVLLSSRGGNAFWRQRASSKAMGSIMGTIEAEVAEGKEGKTEDMKILGALVAASAFACTLPVELLDKTWGEDGKIDLIECLVTGIVLAEKRGGGGGWTDGAWGSVVKNSLASFLRLIGGGGEREEMLNKRRSTLLPIMLHHASSACSISAILALECTIKLGGSKEVKEDKVLIKRICEGLKESLSHDRREVREKAVEARNLYMLL